MSPDVIIAGGTAVLALGTISGMATFVARLVRAPLESAVEKVRDNLTDLTGDVQHNRANADSKFVAVEVRLTRNTDDIVTLGKADVEHAVAIRHLEEMVRSRLDMIKDRLDDASAARESQFDQLAEAIRDLRHENR